MSSPTKDAYIASLRAQIGAVYRTAGGPEPVMFANIAAQRLSTDFIDRLNEHKSINVHAKRQMAICLTALEQAKDAAAKAFMMPDEKSVPEESVAKKAKVEKPPAAAAADAESFAAKSTLHVVKVKLGESYCIGCVTWRSGWSVLEGEPMRISCDVCHRAKLFDREEFRTVAATEASSAAVASSSSRQLFTEEEAAAACPHGCIHHFHPNGCPDCKIQSDRDAAVAAGCPRGCSEHFQAGGCPSCIKFEARNK